jgi:hypothetical protein
MSGYAQCIPAGFSAAHDKFVSLATWLDGEQAGGMSHGAVEDHLGVMGRDLLRQLMQDHFTVRAQREVRQPEVVDADGVHRRSVEAGHSRTLTTVYGDVTVERLAYRAKGARNLCPADAVLNLPPQQYSHGLRRLAALESVRDSFDGGRQAIERATAVTIGTRQLRQLVVATAVDIDAFYQQRRPKASCDTDIVVITADAKGIVMRPEALREATRKNAEAKGGNKLATRLSSGEKHGRKRMAEVGSVYDLTPVPRTPKDIIVPPPAKGAEPAERVKGPVARDKWLHASVEHSAPKVIAELFAEAHRRDPEHQRDWVVLVDGSDPQIRQIKAQAAKTKVKITIVLDLIHVLELSPV